MNLNPAYGVALFTDGSANNRDRSGGWAWVALDAFEGTWVDCGRGKDTTISQMELLAPTLGLSSLYGMYGAIDVIVYSDSQYVVLGCNDSTRKRNANLDWWDDLDGAIKLHNIVVWEHVKGHAGNKYNEMADKLAVQARKGNKSDK